MTDTLIHCNNCQEEHIVSEAFCRSMNPAIARHDQWMSDRAAGIPEHESPARRWNSGLVGGPGKPSTHVLDRHQSPITLRDFNQPRPPVEAPTEPLVTPPMAKYIRDLLASRAVSDDLKARWSAQVVEGHETLSKDKGHKAIDWLKKQPYAHTGMVAQPAAARVAARETFKVTDGRYAIDPVGESSNGTVFYRVAVKGNYINVYRYKSDQQIELSWSQAQGVLRRIEQADLKAAMIRFGQEMKKCGHCGRKLTDDVSRANGYGPVCAQWF